jgi:hypothetical protein
MYLISIIFQITALNNYSQLFSGFYNPNVNFGLEVYAGSWLMSTTLFLSKKNEIDKITELEMTSTNMIIKKDIFDTYGVQKSIDNVIMTRDYFDLQVEHLSPMTNQMNRQNEDSFQYLYDKSLHKTKTMKKIVLNQNYKNKFSNQVIAVIPYSMHGSMKGEESQLYNDVRLNFFEMTFWSIYRYFSYICVSVTVEDDYDSLVQLNLPIYHIFKSIDTSTSHTNIPVWLNSKQSLYRLHQELSSNKTWYETFKFVYFSEADTILHMRQIDHLYDIMIKSLDGKEGHDFILVPHRMQV